MTTEGPATSALSESWSSSGFSIAQPTRRKFCSALAVPPSVLLAPAALLAALLLGGTSDRTVLYSSRNSFFSASIVCWIVLTADVAASATEESHCIRLLAFVWPFLGISPHRAADSSHLSI
jgi:hypothetical protein